MSAVWGSNSSGIQSQDKPTTTTGYCFRPMRNPDIRFTGFGCQRTMCVRSHRGNLSFLRERRGKISPCSVFYRTAHQAQKPPRTPLTMISVTVLWIWNAEISFFLLLSVPLAAACTIQTDLEEFQLFRHATVHARGWVVHHALPHRSDGSSQRHRLSRPPSASYC